MVAYALARRLTPNLALIAAGALGALVALAALLLPGAMLEQAVLASGIAAFIPAAEPPLGVTARICVAIFTGGGAAAALWFALNVAMGLVPSRGTVTVVRRPTVRRADAHPDAPPREPLRAGRDLGFDLLSPDLAKADEPAADAPDVELPPEPVIAMGGAAPASPVLTPEPLAPPPPVQSVPCDLDQPLAAYDPGAVLETPLPPPSAVAPLRRASPQPAAEPVLPIDTFQPSARPAPAPAPAPTANIAPHTSPKTGTTAAPHPPETVNALLDRLEQGIARRENRAKLSQPAPRRRLNDTLDDLRKLAVRA